MSELSDILTTAAGQPLKVSSDAGSVEGHSLADLIAADEKLSANTAANQEGNPVTNNGRRGYVIQKFRRGGTA
jgi:imidazolonepropionase-like amidohydrolase